MKAYVDEIKKSEEQLRKIIDTTPTLVWCSPQDDFVEFLNRRWLEYTGLSTEQALDGG